MGKANWPDTNGRSCVKSKFGILATRTRILSIINDGGPLSAFYGIPQSIGTIGNQESAADKNSTHVEFSIQPPRFKTDF